MFMKMNVQASVPVEHDCSLTTPLPRLIRFVDGLPDGYLAQLDPVRNILRIDRNQYDQLNESDRHRVQKTRELNVLIEQ